MARRIPYSEIVRWTGVGLSAATLLTWSISLLLFPPIDERKGKLRGTVNVDDEFQYILVPVLAIFTMAIFLLAFSPVRRKLPATHCRKRRSPLISIASGPYHSFARRTGLGLCVAVILAWIISLRFYPSPPLGMTTVLASDSGFLLRENSLYFYSMPTNKSAPATKPVVELRRWPELGVDIFDFTQPGGPALPRVFLVAVPFWLLFLAVATFTAFVMLYPMRRKVSLTHCRKCKYPLTGNTSGRCPECGTFVPTFRPASAAQLAVPRTISHNSSAG